MSENINLAKTQSKKLKQAEKGKLVLHHSLI
jgi:hypothetical protein